MTIKTGDTIPSAIFRTPSADGPANITSEAIFAGKTVVLFAVPGAFTPTCSNNHLPGYVELNDQLRAKGVDTIAVVATNDVFVMGAWAKSNGSGEKITYLSDGNGEFTRSIGMEADMSGAGFGLRSKRYSMLVRDGIVKIINLEEERGVNVSGAHTILEQL